MKPSGSPELLPTDPAVSTVPAVSWPGFEESEGVAVVVEESEEVEVVVVPKT